ncbi:amidohydrolase [Enterococcus moraviensis ATCC BAA-383]|uniref:Amidohydrolase n=1 Tax=Enterococcus moraviensis ATCC BAA-383 TaxID=1158609 RepID=R2T6K2_9ENTE|nr:amidohydrolase [Enterococcus moraviensis]EOI03023.1 amidohydrolase [Enterococcus moraviensis ATCC BAA-383]EOT74100.1 M20/M25/M40 family peptidase [Enterococcus moraviensis ATCC BAA-383]OJG67207.1 amidohydrolase [Enterococcus moraviensis]
MTTVTKQSIQEEIQQHADEVIALRRHFHQYPEASLKEFETIKRIKEELDKLAIPFEEVGETGVLATIKGKKGSGKTIILRADIDALELEDGTGREYQSKNPGLNHACGHDGHAAALLGAAKILKNHEDDFAGTIKLAFQPAEEIGAGACQFVEGGFVENIDQVFGIHLDSSVPVGKLVATKGATNASCDIFTIEVEGLSSHVAQPNVGRDAVLSAASIVVELQKIAAREVSPLDPVVVGIGVLDAGTRYNIVANHARIEGTVRAFSHETRAFVLQRVEEIANQIAEAHRTKIASFHIHDAAGPLINDDTATELAQKVAAEIVGSENVVTDHTKSLGADDFADFLLKAPGVYGRVGTRNLDNPETQYGHHHEKFDIDEAGLALATEFHVRYALTYLNSID